MALSAITPGTTTHNTMRCGNHTVTIHSRALDPRNDQTARLYWAETAEGNVIGSWHPGKHWATRDARVYFRHIRREHAA
ncbi:hypothetical protein ACFXG4_48485 [Nocardia sp. NPDC059246]|uniref:hypothetical protein n=1 Tax=unclassified Nocardia TaxID=2637762 RepID=UPI0036855ED8